MSKAEDFVILQGHVYQHNKQNLTIGLPKPVKLKNSRYFLNTPRIFQCLIALDISAYNYCN